MATTICLDFLMFPDNTPMPLPFTLAGFSFAFFSIGSPPFVNESGGDKGLQFPDQGIKIKLPVPSTKVRVKIGQFSSPVTITVSSATGATLASDVTNTPNAYVIKNFRLKRKAALVTLTGGNNEGILAEICYTV